MKIRDSESTKFAGAKRQWRIYRRISKPKNIKMDISLDEFIYYCQQPCYYCHKLPFRQVKLQNTRKFGTPNKDGFLFNGLTKIVMDKGVVNGNVRTCCSGCNWKKLDLDEKDFLIWIDRIYKYQHRFDNNGDNNGTKRPT